MTALLPRHRVWRWVDDADRLFGTFQGGAMARRAFWREIQLGGYRPGWVMKGDTTHPGPVRPPRPSR